MKLKTDRDGDKDDKSAIEMRERPPISNLSVKAEDPVPLVRSNAPKISASSKWISASTFLPLGLK